MTFLSGVVMIRCDIHKGKLRLGNFIEPGRDAQPRKDEGFVLDHGNIGKKLSFNILKFDPWKNLDHIDLCIDPDLSMYLNLPMYLMSALRVLSIYENITSFLDTI